MRRTSTTDERRRPRCSLPCVARRRFICATTRCTAATSWAGLEGSARSSSRSGLAGRQRLGALDQRPLELAPHVALEGLQALARHRVGVGQLGAGLLALQAERAADALHVHADHAGALALAPEGRDRQPRQVAHLAVGARADGVADPLPQGFEVEPLGAGEALLLKPSVHGLALDRPEEEALKQGVQHVAVLLRLREGRGQRLAEVLARGPAHSVERLEGVEQLGGAHGHALLAQLVGELEQARRHPRRAGHRHRPVEAALNRPAAPRGFHRPASRPRARPPGLGRCGA